MKNSNLSIEQRLENIENLLLSQKTVLNFNEAAEFTGLSKSHLYQLTSKGGIPVYCPSGKKLYFNREELQQWLLRNKKKTKDEIESEANAYVTINKRQR